MFSSNNDKADKSIGNTQKSSASNNANLNNKSNMLVFSKEVTEKLKEKISIQEDDHNFIYNLNNATEEEEDEYEEYEEEEIKEVSKDEKKEEKLSLGSQFNEAKEHCNEGKNKSIIDTTNTPPIGNTITANTSITNALLTGHDSGSLEAVPFNESKATIVTSPNQFQNNVVFKNESFSTPMTIRKKKIDNLSIFKKTSDKLDKEEFHDPTNANSYVHGVFRRGTTIDLRILLSLVPCYKLRHRFKFVKLFYDKKEDYYFHSYFIFFDEMFIYFIKNTELEFLPKDDDRRAYLRLIGKNYNIKKLDKIKVCDYDEDKIKITITFKLHDINQEFGDENVITKDVFFDLKSGDLFFKMLKYFSNKNRIPLNIPESYYNSSSSSAATQCDSGNLNPNKHESNNNNNQDLDVKSPIEKSINNPLDESDSNSNNKINKILEVNITNITDKVGESGIPEVNNQSASVDIANEKVLVEDNKNEENVNQNKEDKEII